MKFYPAQHSPAPLAGLSHTRAPWYANRRTAILLAAVLFAAGFFSGAIAFGEVLIRSIPTEAAP